MFSCGRRLEKGNLIYRHYTLYSTALVLTFIRLDQPENYWIALNKLQVWAKKTSRKSPAHWSFLLWVSRSCVWWRDWLTGDGLQVIRLILSPMKEKTCWRWRLIAALQTRDKNTETARDTGQWTHHWLHKLHFIFEEKNHYKK